MLGALDQKHHVIWSKEMSNQFLRSTPSTVSPGISVHVFVSIHMGKNGAQSHEELTLVNIGWDACDGSGLRIQAVQRQWLGGWGSNLWNGEEIIPYKNCSWSQICLGEARGSPIEHLCYYIRRHLGSSFQKIWKSFLQDLQLLPIRICMVLRRPLVWYEHCFSKILRKSNEDLKGQKLFVRSNLCHLEDGIKRCSVHGISHHWLTGRGCLLQRLGILGQWCSHCAAHVVHARKINWVKQSRPSGFESWAICAKHIQNMLYSAIFWGQINAETSLMAFKCSLPQSQVFVIAQKHFDDRSCREPTSTIIDLQDDAASTEGTKEERQCNAWQCPRIQRHLPRGDAPIAPMTWHTPLSSVRLLSCHTECTVHTHVDRYFEDNNLRSIHK